MFKIFAFGIGHAPVFAVPAMTALMHACIGGAFECCACGGLNRWVTERLVQEAKPGQ